MKRLPLTAEQSALCAKYIPMAKALAKPLRVNWPRQAEDFEGAALLALVEAAQSFDTSRNVKFSTFARYRIWGALRDVQRECIVKGFKYDPDAMPIMTSLTSRSEEEGIVLTGGPTEATIEAQFSSLDFVETQSKKLRKANGDVIRLMFVNGKTQAEVAEILGFSKSRISYLYKEALKELSHNLTRIAC